MSSEAFSWTIRLLSIRRHVTSSGRVRRHQAGRDVIRSSKMGTSNPRSRGTMGGLCGRQFHWFGMSPRFGVSLRLGVHGSRVQVSLLGVTLTLVGDDGLGRSPDNGILFEHVSSDTPEIGCRLVGVSLFVSCSELGWARWRTCYGYP